MSSPAPTWMNDYLKDDNEPKKAFPVGALGQFAANNSLSHEQVRERVRKGIPPATAEEYLLRVRLEAEGYPSVTTAASSEGEPKRSSRGTEEADRSGPFGERANEPESLPTGHASRSNGRRERPRRDERLISWERHVVSLFRQGRQYINRLEHQLEQHLDGRKIDVASIKKINSWKDNIPALNDGYAWEYLCLGTTVQANRNVAAKMQLDGKEKSLDMRSIQEKNASSASRSTHGRKGVPPVTSIIVLLKPGATYKLFKRHVKWLETSHLTRSKACWLYALMFKLEKPLNGDCASTMRDLARRLLVLEEDAALEDDKNALFSVDILLAVIGQFFNQMNML